MEQVSYWICEIALLISSIIYMRTLERRERFWMRVLVDATFYLVLVGLLNLLPWTVTSGWGILMQMLFFLFLIHFLHSGWILSYKDAVYYTIWAFVVWQLLYELTMFIFWVVGRQWVIRLPLIWLIQILVFFVGYALIAATFGKWLPEGGKRQIGPRQCGLAVLIFVLFENIAILPELVGIEMDDSSWVTIYIMQILLAVILYLQNELFKKSAIRQELELMNILWNKEKEQYKISKENIALINQKCHDLKHQIRALRNAGQEDVKQYLEEMEESVQIYEAIVKTGNEVLDTILTEKSLYCKERRITVSCVADGSQMDFIHTVDLYAILGNALDNAIEAVEQFEHEEKRQIDVLIRRQQEMLLINVINPTKGNLVYEEEFPITTKKDKEYHGYGLRSIRYMVKKYDGFVNISEEDGCFSLTILMPIPR